MSKEKKDKHFIKKPIYPGGSKAYNEFIKKNIKYPSEALKNKIEGTVYLKYDIDYTGKVTDVKVIKSLGNGLDKEAIRVIKLLKFEIPKGPRKLRVLFHKEAKIKFTLPKAQKTKTSTPQSATSYIITTTKTKKEPEQAPKEKQSGSYGYTIKW